MPRPPRASRLIPQKPTRKTTSLLGRYPTRNSRRRRRDGIKVWPTVMWFTPGAGVPGGYRHRTGGPLLSSLDLFALLH